MDLALSNNYPFLGGADYQPPTSPTLSFASGARSTDTPTCTTLQLLQDSVVEYNENFTIYLTSSFLQSQVQISPTAGSSTFTIIEDSDSKWCITLSKMFHTTDVVGSNYNMQSLQIPLLLFILIPCMHATRFLPTIG